MNTAATTLKNTMGPTLAYYDANQAAPAISKVDWVSGACATGTIPQTELYRWPGTAASTG